MMFIILGAITFLAVSCLLWLMGDSLKRFVVSMRSPKEALRAEAVNALAERQHRAENSREGLLAEAVNALAERQHRAEYSREGPRSKGLRSEQLTSPYCPIRDARRMTDD